MEKLTVRQQVEKEIALQSKVQSKNKNLVSGSDVLYQIMLPAGSYTIEKWEMGVMQKVKEGTVAQFYSNTFLDEAKNKKTLDSLDCRKTVGNAYNAVRMYLTNGRTVIASDRFMLGVVDSLTFICEITGTEEYENKDGEIRVRDVKSFTWVAKQSNK